MTVGSFLEICENIWNSLEIFMKVSCTETERKKSYKT